MELYAEAVSAVKKELKAEIAAQTERFRKAFGTRLPLRFDGHQHTQMIPVVYWALLEVIVERITRRNTSG